MITQSSEQFQKEEIIIGDLAEKLRYPKKVKETVLKSTNKNPSLDSYPWSDFSLSHGYPALVLFYAHLDRHFPKQGWDLVAHDYILEIVASIEANGIKDFSLFAGLSGICLAILHASKEKTRYQNLLQTLNLELVDAVQSYYLPLMQENIANKAPSPTHLYDLIQGVTGIGAYLIQDLNNSLLHHLLISIIHTLIERCHPIQVNGYEVPGWYLPCHFQFTEQDQRLFPQGNFNLGLAHGVPGILALLALAYTKGIRLEHQIETIRQIADWLMSKQKNSVWPDRISFECETVNAVNVDPIQRDAWCYGTPGVARSLYLAANALQDDRLRNEALGAFKKIFYRSEEEWWLPGPTFCHGILGLLAITRRMAQETNDSFLAVHTEILKQKLIDYYNPYLPFGFQDLEPLTFQKGASHLSYIGINKAGLLEGAAGIGLGLLELNIEHSHWDAPFLIH